MEAIRLTSFEVPITLTCAEGGDKTVNLDLTEAVRQIVLGSNTESEEPFAHVKAFQTWFESTTGVVISLGQADELMDRLESAYADAKKKRSWQPTLPSSTGSTPGS